MYVSDLALTDFRSYRNVVLHLDPGVTAFVGPNGQGKTNLVESLGYLSTFSSHRVSADSALVRAGAERAVIQAKMVSEARTSLLELEVVAGKANRARLNRSPLPRARSLAGLLRTVTFAPEDLSLVRSDPSRRRRFLDDLLVLLSPKLAGLRSEYERVIRQRNALLKSAGARRRNSGNVDLRTLDVWDDKAAHAGAQLIAARITLIRALRPHVVTAYHEVSSGQSQAHLSYRASLAEVSEELGDAPPTEDDLAQAELVEAHLAQAMAKLRQKEIDRGISLVGPHRDDLVLYLNDLPAKGYASHGESWSFALALRLASYELLRADEGWHDSSEPILILDDVFAELDSRRRDRLVELIAPAEQVLITAAVGEDVPEQLGGSRVDVMGSEATRVR